MRCCPEPLAPLQSQQPLNPLLIQHRGFTLIELLIVVAVLGVVSLVAAPSLTEILAKSAVKGAANEAFSDLHYARSESVQRNTTVTVTFSGGGYTITTGASTTLKTVSLSGPSITAGSGATVVFSPTRATATVSGAPVDFGHTQTTASLRVNVNTLGRAELCTPGGAMTGYSAC